jgi:hypothetical protein
MVTKVTRWTPDHDPTVSIEYEWDNEVPEDARVHTIVKVSRRGVDVPPGQMKQEYDKVLADNQRKNLSLDDLLAYLASANVPKTIDDLKWEFDPETGVVTIKVAGLNNNQFNTATTRLQQKFGATVVLVKG